MPRALQSAKAIKSRSYVKWLVIAAALPITLLVVGSLYTIKRERDARLEFERLTTVHGSADDWMAERFRQAASTEGTVAWSKISLLSGASVREANELPIVGIGQLPDPWDPREPWKQEQAVASYLAEMRPVLELIEASSNVAMPVWQPMEFDGLATLLPELQESRQIQRLLQLEALFAIHQGQAARGLSAIRSMQATVEAYDWRMFLVGELVNTALRGMLFDTIGKALAADIWNAQQLAELNALVADPLPIAEKWSAAWASEENFLCSRNMEQELGPAISASDKLQMLRLYRELSSMGSLPPGAFSQRMEEWDQAQARRLASQGVLQSSLQRLLMPAVAQMAVAFERLEFQRRLVLTAVAVKRYRLEQDAWPGQLENLSQVGLRPDDWTVPGRGKFGYEFDSDFAIVYDYSAHQPNVTQPMKMPASIGRFDNWSYDEIIIR